MSFLSIRDLEKSFGATRVVEKFNLDVEKGEFVSLLGPSGCGKTTVLRMIAGFETPSAGEIVIEGKNVIDVPTRRREVGMVFQAYALFPNLTVARNVGFGLKIAGVQKAEIAARVEEMLRMIGLPARGAGPRAGAAPARAAARRAALRARRQDPRQSAQRDSRHPARTRHHHFVRDARSGGGAVDVRSRRRHAQGPRRAGRRAA
jgi:ABC-type Fe3+/spermidine/putrescine transport system ATPase subunit